MLLTLIGLPAGLLTAALGYVDTIFGELYPLVALCIGLPLAFWAIRKIVSLVRAR